MLDSPFLESLLSMVFVYGILSALASIVQEIQAQYLDIRPFFLVTAIRRMLSDDLANAKAPTVKSEIWDFLKKGLKIVSFPASFPMMKMWAPPRMLAPSSKHDPAIHGPTLDLEKDYALADEFFENSMIKYMGARDAKKPSYISRDAFTSVLLDICHLKKTPNSEDDLANIQFTPKLPVSVKAVMVSLVREAYRSTCHEKDQDCRQSAMDKRLRELVSKWYDDTMHRATGWYKRDAGKWLFWWGLAIAMLLNADTFRLFRHFNLDSSSRQMVKSQALQFNENSAAFRATFQTDSNSALTPMDSLQARLARHWNGEIKNLERAHVFGWRFPQVSAKNKSADRPTWRVAVDDFCAGLPSKIRIILIALPGLLGTALAISFGAPFWFDILSSLVKVGGTNASMRFSGVKPEAKKP